MHTENYKQALEDFNRALQLREAEAEPDSRSLAELYVVVWVVTDENGLCIAHSTGRRVDYGWRIARRSGIQGYVAAGGVDDNDVYIAQGGVSDVLEREAGAW